MTASGTRQRVQAFAGTLPPSQYGAINTVGPGALAGRADIAAGDLDGEGAAAGIKDLLVAVGGESRRCAGSGVGTIAASDDQCVRS